MGKRLSIRDFAKKELGIILPDDLVKFLETHDECLNDNPFDRTEWKSGFGDIHFICGTTKAFRSRFPNFPETMVIIGYLGQKEIVVNRQVTFIDEYIGVDTLTDSVYLVDSLGKLEKIGERFSDWLKHFMTCLKNHEPSKPHHMLEYFKKKFGK